MMPIFATASEGPRREAEIFMDAIAPRLNWPETEQSWTPNEQLPDGGPILLSEVVFTASAAGIP